MAKDIFLPSIPHGYPAVSNGTLLAARRLAARRPAPQPPRYGPLRTFVFVALGAAAGAAVDLAPLLNWVAGGH